MEFRIVNCISTYDIMTVILITDYNIIFIFHRKTIPTELNVRFDESCWDAFML